jgi:hypothetical protein
MEVSAGYPVNPAEPMFTIELDELETELLDAAVYRFPESENVDGFSLQYRSAFLSLRRKVADARLAHLRASSAKS